MKVFISSVVGGYEAYRSAAADAIETLRHQVLRSEDFPASAGTPQQACLTAVRDADVVVLLLGARYGTPQASGLSATHEEYREARGRKPVLVFVEAGTTPEPAQRAFIQEVGEWATGQVWVEYSTPPDLKERLIRALHEYEIAVSVGHVDENEMVARAREKLTPEPRFGGSARLILAVVGGPHQQVLSPAEIEDPNLARELHQEAMFGPHSVLDSSLATDTGVQGDTLAFRQDRSFVTIDQAGSVSVGRPPERNGQQAPPDLPVLIEEDIRYCLARALRFTAWVLDHVDPTHRLTDAVVAAKLVGATFMPWRTRSEHQASPNVVQMGSGESDLAIFLTPPRRHRQALTQDADRIVEDLVVLLRRARST